MNKKELLSLSIGIFLTVIAWLIADIYHAATQEKLKNKVALPTVKQYDISREVLQQLREKNQ